MAQAGLRGLNDVDGRVVAECRGEARLADHDIGGGAGCQFAHVPEAQYAVVERIGNVEVGRIGGAVDRDRRIGAGAVVEEELAPFNQVDAVRVETILSEHTGGNTEVAGLLGQHDYAIIACVGDVKFVVYQDRG